MKIWMDFMPRRYKPMRNKTRKKEFVPWIPQASTVYRPDQKEYPSLEMSGAAALLADRRVQIDVSKSYTIAPAYNKGAAQVVPQSDIKHIGRA
jgi:hypothetical protein